MSLGGLESGLDGAAPLVGRELSAVVWKWIGTGSITIAIGLTLFALVGNPRGLFYVYFGRYTDYLRRSLRALHLFRPVEPIALAQIVALFGVASLAAAKVLPYWYVAAGLVAVAPAIWIQRQLKARIAKLDAQADGFATALANGLKASPAIGHALENVAGLMDGPVAQEFQLALKETRLGRSLDEALHAVAVRGGSSKLGTVLAALLIGRQVGGNLVKTLETTASTLRELERLEGVMRQRTAEARMQMWAMTFAPFVLCFGIHQVEPNFFDPLTESFTGYVCVVVALVAYVAALLVGRRILAVDL